MNKLLCPSMMCANYASLELEVKSLEDAGIDRFHIDIMDGHFVPNFGMGLQDLEYIASAAAKPVDVHLMIEKPGNYAVTLAELGADTVYIHPQAEDHPLRTLQKLREAGIKTGVAVDPSVGIEQVKPLLYLADSVLMMMVNPGFAGQTYIEFVEEKLESLILQKEKYGYNVIIDGACSPERIKALAVMGADGFVLGTSALFGKGRAYKEIIAELRN